jgi:hypothetical protein
MLLLSVFVEHPPELFKAQDAVAVPIEFGEHRLDLLLAELFGDLLEFILGDVAVVVLRNKEEGYTSRLMAKLMFSRISWFVA